MDKIIPAFEVSLFEPAFSSVFELSEMGIDSILDEGLLKNIPIVSLVIGLGKTAQNIHDRNLLQQTLTFIKSFNENNVNKQKLQRYKEKISKNKRIAEEELGRILIILNNTIDSKKAELMGKIFKSYVDEYISWEQFCEYTELITRMFIGDVNLLLDVNDKRITESVEEVNYKIDRLVSIGLIETTTKSMTVGSNFNSKTERYLKVTEFGRMFCTIIK